MGSGVYMVMQCWQQSIEVMSTQFTILELLCLWSERANYDSNLRSIPSQAMLSGMRALSADLLFSFPEDACSWGVNRTQKIDLEGWLQVFELKGCLYSFYLFVHLKWPVFYSAQSVFWDLRCVCKIQIWLASRVGRQELAKMLYCVLVTLCFVCCNVLLFFSLNCIVWMLK